MGLGAGALIGAIAFGTTHTEGLIQLPTLVFFGLGALVFYFASRWTAQSARKRGAKLNEKTSGIVGQEPETGRALAVGILLDSIPESFVLGISIVAGGSVSVAFLAAIMISNISEALGASANLRVAKMPPRRIYGLFGLILVLCAVFASLGYWLVVNVPSIDGHMAEVFAAGAVLTMLSNSMMPEAYREGGAMVGLMVVFGFVVSAALA